MKTGLAALLWCAGLLAQSRPIDEAWDLLAAGKRDQAVRLLRDIANRDPRDADARLLLGSVLAEAGERAEAIAQLQDGVRLRPNSAEAHYALGEAFQGFGEKEAARSEFENAVRLGPDFTPARVSLGAILVEAGQFEPAAPHLDRAIQLLGRTPDAAYPRYLRAKVYTGQNQIERAEADLNEAVLLRPDFAEAWSDLGQARKARLDQGGALAAFQRAVTLSPDDAVAQTRLGSEYLHQGQAHAALPHLREAVRLNPKNQSALYNLQMALIEDGEKDEAREIKQQLLEMLRQRDKQSENELAAVELNNQGADKEKHDDLPGALEKYRAALRLNPEHVGIRTNLAIALLRMGQWEQGIAELREAVRRDPKNSMLNAALADALAKAPAGAGVPRAAPHR